MNFQGVEICCPCCQGDFNKESESLLVCRECGRQYPVILGIPDLRLFSDPYIDMQADREKGMRVGTRLHELSFEQLVDYYYSITPAVPAQHAAQYKRGLMSGLARAAGALASWESMSGRSNGKGGVLLEIGCGTGPLLAAACGKFKRMVGLDISFRWLVVAKKRLAEAGVEAPLICGCAEALPFPAEQFDMIALESTIENVQDQRKTVRECRRVARAASSLCLSTPNRYSLGPDPHLGLWGGSLLPGSWLEAYARWVQAVPPKRHLLSASTLERLLTDAGFDGLVITVPEVSADQRRSFGPLTRTLVDSYHVGRKIHVTREMLRLVGPLLHAVAVKPMRMPAGRQERLEAETRAV